MVYAPVGMPLDHPALEPLYAEAAKLDLAVVLHTFTVMPPYAPGGQDTRDNLWLQRSAAHPWCGIHPVLPAPVEHFRGRIVAVGAQQDLDLWPMAAQGADHAAHKAADLHPARPLAGPQQRGDKAALCVGRRSRDSWMARFSFRTASARLSPKWIII
jgi:hypothetical protein